MAPVALEAMAAAGMFRLATPVEVGGIELDHPHLLAVIEEIAVGDVAAAWYVVNSTPIGLRSAYLSAADRDRVWSGEGTHASFSGLLVGTATPVDGGYALSGRWPLVTGCVGPGGACSAGWSMRPTAARATCGSSSSSRRSSRCWTIGRTSPACGARAATASSPTACSCRRDSPNQLARRSCSTGPCSAYRCSSTPPRRRPQRCSARGDRA
ncbi:MAG: acyl-CoA dehydrogenase family protein [Acidimicrobiia bacterium]